MLNVQQLPFRFFVNKRLEGLFRADVFSQSYSRTTKLLGACWLLFIFGIACEAGVLHNYASAYSVRIILAAVAAAAMLVLLTMSARWTVENYSQFAFAALFTATGCLWAASTSVLDDQIGLVSSAAGIIAFLAIGHTFAKQLLLPSLLASSWIVTLCYVVLAAVYRNSEESTAHLVSQLGFVVIANGALCWASQEFEGQRRLSFVHHTNVTLLQVEERNLRKEAFVLKNEVSSMLYVPV